MYRKQPFLYGFIAVLLLVLAVSGYFFFFQKEATPSFNDQLAQETWAPEEFILRERPYFQECVEEFQFIAVGLESKITPLTNGAIRTDDIERDQWLKENMLSLRHLRETLRILPYVQFSDQRVELENRLYNALGEYPYSEEVYDAFVDAALFLFAHELEVYSYIRPDGLSDEVMKYESFRYANGMELLYMFDTHPYLNLQQRKKGYEQVSTILGVTVEELDMFLAQIVLGEEYIAGQKIVLSGYSDGFSTWREKIDYPLIEYIGRGYNDAGISFDLSPVFRILLSNEMYHRRDRVAYDGTPFRLFPICAFGVSEYQPWERENLRSLRKVYQVIGRVPLDSEKEVLRRGLSHLENKNDMFDVNELSEILDSLEINYNDSDINSSLSTVEWVIQKHYNGLFKVLDKQENPFNGEIWEYIKGEYLLGTASEASGSRWPIRVKAIEAEMESRNWDLDNLLQ